MSLSRSVRSFIIGLFAVTVILSGSRGLKFYAQQPGGGLTPPPKPITTKPAPAPNSTIPTIINGAPFPIGERLAYNVSWADLPVAARAEMEVVGQGVFFGQESYQLRAKLETVGQMRSLFGELDNQYTSYVSLKNALPHRAVNSLRQGIKQTEETVVFDHAKKQAIFADDSTLTIQADTYDITALIYAVRLHGLPADGKQKFTVVIGKDLIEIEATIKGRERVTTQTGAYNTVLVKFDPQKKYDKYRAHVWFSDDAQRLPVVVTTRLPIGEMRAELTSATVAMRSLPPVVKGSNPNADPGKVMVIEPPTNGHPRVESGEPAGINLPFVVGERLSYDIAWGNFASVGKASFEVRQQGMLGKERVFEFYGEAASVGAARTLINVNDQLSSFVQVDSLLPVRTDLRLREGRRVKQVTANYDWARRAATLTNGTAVALQPRTFDLLSLFYAVRTADLKVGATYNFPFLDANHRLQTVVVRVIKQEAIGGPLGTRDTLQLDLIAPAPANALLAQVWISNDARRLPLYLVTRTRFGELRFQLTNAANTK